MYIQISPTEISEVFGVSSETPLDARSSFSRNLNQEAAHYYYHDCYDNSNNYVYVCVYIYIYIYMHVTIACIHIMYDLFIIIWFLT